MPLFATVKSKQERPEWQTHAAHDHAPSECPLPIIECRKRSRRCRPPSLFGVERGNAVPFPLPKEARRKRAMGHSEYDPGVRDRRPWNAGRKLGGKRALKPQQVWTIRFWLDRERQLRDRAMFDLAIDSKLRATSLKSRSASLSVAAGFARERSLFSRRPVAPFSSSSLSLPAVVSSLGSNAQEVRSTTSSFRAGLIMPIISAPGSTLASLTSG
jgi:hypothetical protein